jgi:outer membrane translocation and assembly module TamA
VKSFVRSCVLALVRASARPSVPALRVVGGAAVCVTTLATGCAQTRAAKLPGETDLRVTRVDIVPREGASNVDFEPLLPRLGSRPGNAFYTDRRYNPFRVAEDRRRVKSYLESLGYFDAEVDEPRVFVDARDESVAIEIRFVSGRRYTLHEVRIEGAPEALATRLLRHVPSRANEPYELEPMRIARYDMAKELEREGFGHARVYVRTYVDRRERRVSIVYFADPGPTTRIGRISVVGNRKVRRDDILARIGLQEGEPYTLTRREKAEVDLLDTGAFAQVAITASADVEQYLGDLPDTGGVIPDERIADDGTLRPRVLPDTIDLTVNVVESPRLRLLTRATLEADPTRGDATASAELSGRNVLGSQHHVTVRGRIGYGLLFVPNDETAWGNHEGIGGGFYGDALLRYTRPSAFGRLLDGRVSARYRDVLYPGFRLRELFVGPGVRTTIAQGVFVEGDVGYRLAGQADFGPFDDAVRTSFALADRDVAYGAEATASFVWDARNDVVEATRGHLLALRATASPGGPLATNRYVVAAPEARAFLPLGTNVSLGFRASGGWVLGYDARGVPLGPRLFGGGAFGMRGVGRDRLSPLAPTACAAADPTVACPSEFVGGLSLAESSLELRFLPPLKQTGLVVFVDAGGAGRRANPFEQGVSVAAGLGPRIRLWYVPIAIDLAQQFVRDGVIGEHRFLVFARIGEAF